jgi:hypothetical protein
VINPPHFTLLSIIFFIKGQLGDVPDLLYLIGKAHVAALTFSSDPGYST